MKTMLLSLLLLLPVTAHAGERGARCHDEACFENEREAWRVAIAKADGHYAARIDKMLASWTKAGFPDSGFIDKKFAKIHAQYTKEMRAAGLVWFFETQGYDRQATFDIIDRMVLDSETQINIGTIGAWLDKANL